MAQDAVHVRQNVTGIDIVGKVWFKNGLPWRAKGATTIAFVTTNLQATGQRAKARANYGVHMLDALHNTFGVDLVRFQISEPGLDPQNAAYDPAYAGQLKSGVDLALSRGFVVQLSMNAQRFAGPGESSCVPDAGTVRAWQQIGPYYAGNRMVMFEVFNEPCAVNRAQAQADWTAGMLSVVSAIRALPADNILVIDGLQYSRDIRNISLSNIGETYLDRIAWGVHPYFMGGYLDAGTWQAWWGFAADKVPMMASEFGFNSESCIAGDPSTLTALLAFLKTKQIGLIGWGIDYDGTMAVDQVSYRPTTLTGFTACKDGSNTGFGQVFEAWTP
jgi:hypothetical protein